MKLRLTLALAAAAVASVALGGAAVAGRGDHAGQRYVFNGEVLTAPGPNAGSLSVQVEGGNHAALKALIGAAQNQVFTLDANTRVPRDSSLAQVEATPAAHVGDHEPAPAPEE